MSNLKTLDWVLVAIVALREVCTKIPKMHFTTHVWSWCNETTIDNKGTQQSDCYFNYTLGFVFGCDLVTIISVVIATGLILKFQRVNICYIICKNFYGVVALMGDFVGILASISFYQQPEFDELDFGTREEWIKYNTANMVSVFFMIFQHYIESTINVKRFASEEKEEEEKEKGEEGSVDNYI